MDFTFSIYKKVLDAVLDSGYNTITFREYFEKTPEEPFILIRHDVDRRPNNSLQMAKMEKELGIRSTYYFRHIPSVFLPEMMKEIEDMGHEVGFHYEILDKAKGDIEKACEIFTEELADLRKHVQVDTMCMHGNPITHGKNYDVWAKTDFGDYNIKGEAYLSLDFSKVAYFSDTGRRWDGKYSVKDHPLGESICEDKFKCTDELIPVLKSKKYNAVCVLVHPNRWNPPGIGWLAELIGQNIKNCAKSVLKRRANRG